MVVLEERPLPRLGRDDRGVLVGLRPAEVERHHHEAPAARPGDAPQLGHRRGVVLDVLEHMGAQHRVEALVRQVERRHVEREVDALGGQIGRHVLEPGRYREPAPQRPFGREVQEPAGVREQGRAPHEQEPLRPVPLVRAAPPAQHPGPPARALEAVEAVPQMGSDGRAAVTKSWRCSARATPRRIRPNFGTTAAGIASERSFVEGYRPRSAGAVARRDPAGVVFRHRRRRRLRCARSPRPRWKERGPPRVEVPVRSRRQPRNHRPQNGQDSFRAFPGTRPRMQRALALTLIICPRVHRGRRRVRARRRPAERPVRARPGQRARRPAARRCRTPPEPPVDRHAARGLRRRRPSPSPGIQGRVPAGAATNGLDCNVSLIATRAPRAASRCCATSTPPGTSAPTTTPRCSSRSTR